MPNPEKDDTWDTWIEKIDELKPFEIDQKTGKQSMSIARCLLCIKVCEVY